ncbi:unnamed protein product [Cercospora beticola]|nr:unnamed protein product [Cercospora beticola]
MKLLSTTRISLLLAFFVSLPQPSLSRAILSTSVALKNDGSLYEQYSPERVSQRSAIKILLTSTDVEPTPLVHRALPRPGGRPPASLEPPHPPPMPARPPPGTPPRPSAGVTNRPPGVAGPADEPGAAAPPPAIDQTVPDTPEPPKSTSSPLDWGNIVSTGAGVGGNNDPKDDDTDSACTKQQSTTESQAPFLSKLWQFFQHIRIATFLWSSDEMTPQPTQVPNRNCTF